MMLVAYMVYIQSNRCLFCSLCWTVRSRSMYLALLVIVIADLSPVEGQIPTRACHNATTSHPLSKAHSLFGPFGVYRTNNPGF